MHGHARLPVGLGIMKIKLCEKHVHFSKYKGESKAEILLGWIRSLDTYFCTRRQNNAGVG